MSLFGGAKTKSTVADKIGSMKIQSQGYGNVIPLVYGRARVSPTLCFYSNFHAWPSLATIKSGGKGGKKKTPTNITWNYTAALMLGLASHETNGTGQCWVDKKKYATAALAGFAAYYGTDTQPPWGYLTTYEPTKAVNLRGFSYLFASVYPLSDSATLGNHSVEVFGHYSTGAGSDANIADIIPHLLATECGYRGDIVVSETLRAECEALGVLFGFALDTQQSANEVITNLLVLANADAVVRSGVLSIFSKTETALITGTSLTSDDFIAEQGQPTITATRKKPIDCFNIVKLEFLNRANDYNVEIAEAKDEASIADIGTRPAETLKAHSITNATVARNLANLLLSRDLAVRNSYDFSLSLRYIYLEPMDVVMINDLTLGLVNHPVVIKKINITPDFELKISAEDYSSQAYQAVYPAVPTSSPYIPDTNAAVGNINPPIIFAAPASLTASGSELWCAVSSSEALYGGCDIYLSIDAGSSYDRIGTHAGSTRMGVLTAGFAAGAEIDTASTLAVDLSQSNGVLSSVSQASIDSLATLCLVNTEFVAYRDVTLTSLSHYSLGYFRRGLYGSTQGAVTNDKIVRCDDSLFKFAYNPQYAGKAIKLKFPAYNIYSAGGQDLSTVPAYDFVIPGVIWDNGSSLWDSGTSLWSNS